MSDTKQTLTTEERTCGAVLVVGAGIAGIQAALDLSAGGFRVYLVEEQPAVGGRMTSLDKTFPTGDCATCIISPKLVACMRDINIDVFTLARVEKLSGRPGDFTATVRQRPRFVDADKCTACGDCVKACPVRIPSAFDERMGERKAIDKLYPQAAPNAMFVSKKGRAPCSAGCPIDSSVQGYVALIADGKFEEAARVIRRENPLPSICGRVCFHPCEDRCNRKEIDRAVNIRDLKRFAIEKAGKDIVVNNAKPTGKKIAVIGSGPAGLAAAHGLALLGHGVTVYEALPVLGGMMAVGIPPYRLPADILKADLDAIARLGVAYKTKTVIGEDVSVDDLRQNSDAVFIASGAHQSNRLDIPGEDCAQVVHGIDFLRKRTLGEAQTVGKRVIVVGGGNTAIDASRVARRLGAAVTIIYRRTRSEMPAAAEEIDAALAEGIEIQYLTAPVEVVMEKEIMIGVRCVKMKLGRPDQSGRRRPVPVEGSEFVIDSDMLIPAVSQSSDRRMAELFGCAVTTWGTITADDLTFATSADGVFAGGDAVTGPGSVIQSIANGQNAAAAIDNFLSHRRLDEGLTKRKEIPNPLSAVDLQRIKREKEKAERVAQKELEPAARAKDFTEVESTYTEEEAIREAKRCLSCALCSECLACVDACKAQAVDHHQTERFIDLEVGAVILAPGFTAFDPAQKFEYGAGYAQNILTNVQFERVLSASGPTTGRVVRPSDGAHPRSLAFIQCVGSRDALSENDYCSAVCCMVATKEAILAKEHEPGLEVTVFFMDLRAFGKDFERYYERARALGVRYVRCRPSTLEEDPVTKNLRIGYLDENNRYINEEFELAVFSLGLEPSASLVSQARALDVALNEYGFTRTRELTPLNTSRPGIFVAGAFAEPKDIPDTVMQASGAAARAMAFLAPARGSLLRTKTYPQERDVRDESPRVGVFVCHCGSNIASVVDVPAVVEYARGLPGVAYADHEVYVCADDSQDVIKEKIREHGLNRVVVASCTPRTHEAIFRDTLRDAGLNQYLLEMANIRDQCSWVHSAQPEAATTKAKDLIRMIVGRAVGALPLEDEKVPVISSALVIGGGLAGMTASLALAEQGFGVHLVEKDKELGGTARLIHRTLSGEDPAAHVAELARRVNDHSLIQVHVQSRVNKVDGHIGKFESTIANGEGPLPVTHGVVILASGATEKKPEVLGYGQSDRVLTQLELSAKLGDADFSLPDTGTVVMIQCVEQRDKEHPYCSRVCCATAVKNALILKERRPGLSIIVLYRDMRTYGFKELAYKEARQKGVRFYRFRDDNPPRVNAAGDLTVSFHDQATGLDLSVAPELLVLAARVVPQADRETLSELLRVPLNADGFFLEAHVKLRPVDFASEGLFLCGTAHAPKFVSETVSQANAVAGRAAAVLSSSELAVSGQTAWVDQDKCISCMTCVHLCPYNAPRINFTNKAEVQSAVCMGCGSCTSDCPAKAITLRNYTDSQVFGAIRSLLEARSARATVQPVYPDNTGISKIH